MEWYFHDFFIYFLYENILMLYTIVDLFLYEKYGLRIYRKTVSFPMDKQVLMKKY